MIALYVFLGIIAFFLLILFLNVHIIFQYHDTPKVTLRILCFRLNGMKLIQKFQGKNRKPQKQEKTETDTQTDPKTKNNGDLLGFISFLARIARVIRILLKEQMERLKINLKELHISIGTDDAAKTALASASAIQGANALCALLQRFSRFRCDNRNLSISPNFTEEKTRFSIHLDLSTRGFDIIVVLLKAYFRFLEREDPNHARNTIKTGH